MSRPRLLFWLLQAFVTGVLLFGCADLVLDAHWGPYREETVAATPWIWAVPPGDGQWCVILSDQLGPCYSEADR